MSGVVQNFNTVTNTDYNNRILGEAMRQGLFIQERVPDDRAYPTPTSTVYFITKTKRYFRLGVGACRVAVSTGFQG